MVRGFLLPRGDLEKVDFNYLIEMLKKNSSAEESTRQINSISRGLQIKIAI